MMNQNLKEKLFQKGIFHFQNQNFDDAKIFFNKVLALESNNIKANHALGIIHGMLNDHQKAKFFFNKVIKINPQFHPSQINLIISLMASAEYSQAEKKCRSLIKLYPQNPIYFNKLGISLFNQKNFNEAIGYFNKSIDLNPQEASNYKYLGLIKTKQKLYQESIEFFSKALTLNKDDAEINYQIAESFYNLKNFKSAIPYLERCIFLGKDDKILFLAKERLAISYDLVHNFEKSIRLFNELINLELSIENKERILISLSNVHINKHQSDFKADYSLGQHYALETLKINEKNILALNNMGITELYMKNHNAAMDWLKKAYNIDQSHPVTLKNLSNVYDHLGFYEENVDIIRQFKEIKPNDISLDTSLAMSLFSLGKFKEAWTFYEDRWIENRNDGKIKNIPKFEKPRWHPDLGYNKILIWGEQGIGDQILHGTILRDFSKSFKKTYLAIDPKLVQIFKESFPEIEVYSLFDETSTDFFDYQIPLCSIGAYARNSYKDFLPLKNYYSLLGQNTYKSEKNYKCALSWKSPLGAKGDFKSTTLESLKPILELKNIDFYSVQYNDEEDEIKYIEKKYGIKINSINNLDTYKDIYGLMKFIQSCDFTITTSSTNAHLSGALGVPTYLLLPMAYGKIWYWDNFYDGKNVWYPSVKSFIQKEYKNWLHPIDELLKFMVTEYKIKN